MEEIKNAFSESLRTSVRNSLQALAASPFFDVVGNPIVPSPTLTTLATFKSSLQTLSSSITGSSFTYTGASPDTAARELASLDTFRGMITATITSIDNLILNDPNSNRLVIESARSAIQVNVQDLDSRLYNTLVLLLICK